MIQKLDQNLRSLSWGKVSVELAICLRRVGNAGEFANRQLHVKKVTERALASERIPE